MDRGPVPDEEGSAMTVRRIVVLLGLVFAIALAIVVARRMSAEAMAVVVGVVCGVAASIPTSILLLVVLTRRERSRETSDPQAHLRSYPPVVVIQGGAPQALPPGMPAGYWPSMPAEASVQRQFHVVGGEELLDGGRY
jgi:hypothetical protein